MWIDVHAHLFDLSSEALRELINESDSRGVSPIINTAVSLDTAETVLNQCRQFPKQLKAALGISPFDVTTQAQDWSERLEQLLSDPSVIAVGEIGLDKTNPRYPALEKQMPFFLTQLEIAKDKKLPVLVHSRGMERTVAKLCRSSNSGPVVFHCFTGDREALDYILDCGYFISIAGIITYKNAHIRDLLPHIPLDRLFLETDTPYLAPVPKRGAHNQPGYLIYTAEETARILSVDKDTLQKALIDNFQILFNQSPANETL